MDKGDLQELSREMAQRRADTETEFNWTFTLKRKEYQAQGLGEIHAANLAMTEMCERDDAVGRYARERKATMEMFDEEFSVEHIYDERLTTIHNDEDT